jgi:hypothetical protein
MKKYLVVFETRQAGAIGEFSHSEATVEADHNKFSVEDICREAMHQLHARKLETRSPISVREVTAYIEGPACKP